MIVCEELQNILSSIDMAIINELLKDPLSENCCNDDHINMNYYFFPDDFSIVGISMGNEDLDHKKCKY